MKKVVLVTGAGSGIGQAIAQNLAPKEYSLILTSRTAESMEQYAKLENVVIVAGDLTKQDTLDKLIETSQSTFGKVDVLVNNAGITYIQPFEENTPDQMRTLFEINLFAAMQLTQAVYPLMKKQQSGHVLFINSTAGKEGKANHTMYSASKFGLAGFAQAFRQEAQQHGLRVTSIHPGGVKTDLYRNQPEIDTSGYMEVSELAKTIVNLIETESICPDEIIINRKKYLLF